MSNKRSLEQFDVSAQSDRPGAGRPSSLSSNKAKKVKFGALPSTSKQPKSDAGQSSFSFQPTDDSTDLQFDELNQVGKIKRGRIKVDGYDSDSSTENNEVRTDSRKGESNDKDDDDMFGGGEDQENLKDSCNPKFDKVDVGLKLKKGAENKDYLDLGDIEGQEFGRGEDEDADEDEGMDDNSHRHRNEQDGDLDSTNGYSDEEEDFVPGDEFANDDDAPRARRKSKKGMGYLLSKFNMADELKEGRMSADGSYVPSAKDPEAVHDNWLEGVSTKKAIKQAREAKRKREEQLKSQLEKEESLASLRTRKECYIALLGLLPAGDGRSVSQILCQLGNDKRALVQTQKRKKKVIKKSAIDELVPESMVVDSRHSIDENASDRESESQTKSVVTNQSKSDEEIRLDKTIGDLTDLASTLMSAHGDLDIYDMTHGSITGILKSEGLVPRDWIPPSNRDPVLYHSVSKPTSIESSSDQATTTKPSTRKSLIARPSVAAAVQSSQQQPAIYYRFLSDPSNPLAELDHSAVYGPFDKGMMESWAQQGFFGHEFDRIQVKINSNQSNSETSWGPWHQIIGQ